MWGPVLGSETRNTVALAEDGEVAGFWVECVKMLRGIRWQSYF